MRACGALMLFYTVYLLGFYRYFEYRGWFDRSTRGRLCFRWPSLGLGAVGLVLGGRAGSRPIPAWLRNRLLVLLGVDARSPRRGVLGVEAGWISPGAAIEFFDFGWTRHHSLAGWILTIVAWAAWFLLGLWCIAWGATVGPQSATSIWACFAVGVGIVTPLPRPDGQHGGDGNRVPGRRRGAARARATGWSGGGGGSSRDMLAGKAVS